jgi:hypothetical protein
MLSNATLGLCAGFVALVGAPFCALAQDAIAAPGLAGLRTAFRRRESPFAVA